MKETLSNDPGSELRKNLITGAFVGAMLGATFGYSFGAPWPGTAGGILLGLALGYRINRVRIKMRYPAYITRWILLAAAFCFLVSLIFASLVDQGWTGVRATLAAILPIAAWAALVITLGMAIASLDEMQRRIQTEAIAIGFAGTVIICGGYGLLNLADILPALNWGGVVLVMVFMWFLGKMWTMWRYR